MSQDHHIHVNMHTLRPRRYHNNCLVMTLKIGDLPQKHMSVYVYEAAAEIANY
jgi:hypothetical protein